MSKKVQVRIAVAVDAQGRWSASGHHAHSDEDSFNWCAGKNVEHTRYILTAELDVPEVQEVAASVEKGE